LADLHSGYCRRRFVGAIDAPGAYGVTLFTPGLTEAGATTHAIAAWGGWKTLAEVAHYTEAVDRLKLTHAGTEQKQNFDNPANQVVENREKPN